jgi:hypothetical protein
MVQIAIALGLIWCPAIEIPIRTKLERFVAEICGLNCTSSTSVDTSIGTIAIHVMSKMDNCLFYRITEDIVLFDDDTLIFSKRQKDIDQFVVRMNNHYELTLDTKADSFLVGINISNNDDTTVTPPTEPKLLQKLFKEHPERPARRKATRTHMAHNKTYLRLLGLLMYLTKSRPDIIMAASKYTWQYDDEYTLKLFFPFNLKMAAKSISI